MSKKNEDEKKLLNENCYKLHLYVVHTKAARRQKKSQQRVTSDRAEETWHGKRENVCTQIRIAHTLSRIVHTARSRRNAKNETK